MFQVLRSTKISKFLGSVVVISSIICGLISNIHQVQATDSLPQMPSVYYGYVTNNGSPVGAGYTVEARINSSAVAVGITDSQSRYGYSPNPEFSFTCSSGTVYFYVNGVQATVVSCAPGANELNLNVSGAPSTYTAPVVSSGALTLTTASLPGGTINAAYSATLAATGGTPPYAWTVSSDNLPPGLTLGSTGVISGTPTTAMSYSFTVQVTDAASHTASTAYSIAINAASATTTGSSATTTSSGTSTPTPPSADANSSQSNADPSSAIAAFAISNMSATPVSGQSSNEINISVRVANTGKAQGIKTLTLKINDNVEAQQEVVLAPGESQVVTFTVSKNTPGIYKASIDPISPVGLPMPAILPSQLRAGPARREKHINTVNTTQLFFIPNLLLINSIRGNPCPFRSTSTLGL